MAAAAATWVLSSAWAATPLAWRPSPALNPNQPNQRMPAPTMTKGMECGSGRVIGPDAAAAEHDEQGQRRGARGGVDHHAAGPVLRSRLVSQPAGAQSQCAIGG